MTTARTQVPGDRRAPTRGDRQRDAILNGIRRLLQEESIADLSIAQITKEAGLTRSGFYFYFDSKYSALAVVLAEIWRELQDSTEVFARPGPEESPPDFANRVLGKAFEVWRRHESLLVACMQARETDLTLRTIWDALVVELAAGVVEVVDDERRASGGKPATADTEALVRALFGMTLWTLHNDSVDGVAAAECKRHLDALIAVWIRSVWGA